MPMVQPNDNQILAMTMANLREHCEMRRRAFQKRAEGHEIAGKSTLETAREQVRATGWAAQHQTLQRLWDAKGFSPMASVEDESDKSTRSSSAAEDSYKVYQIERLNSVLKHAVRDAISNEHIIACQEKVLHAQHHELQALRQQLAVYTELVLSVTGMVNQEIGTVLDKSKGQPLSSEDVQRLQSVQTMAIDSQQILARLQSISTQFRPGTVPSPRLGQAEQVQSKGACVPSKKQVLQSARPQQTQSDQSSAVHTFCSSTQKEPQPSERATTLSRRHGLSTGASSRRAERGSKGTANRSRSAAIYGRRVARSASVEPARPSTAMLTLQKGSAFD
mmetsp:Transcript_37130/g.66215  ORF Transcript_37130/g.66215 Transcript_37130/m.66215 type:complete len:334 (-) Transcript_37130:186-1187(-)